MTTTATTKTSAYALIAVGTCALVTGPAEDSLPLDVVGCVVAFADAQILVWSGSLVGYPRKRGSAILLSAVTLGLGAILIGIRIYAGPTALHG